MLPKSMDKVTKRGKIVTVPQRSPVNLHPAPKIPISAFVPSIQGTGELFRFMAVEACKIAGWELFIETAEFKEAQVVMTVMEGNVLTTTKTIVGGGKNKSIKIDEPLLFNKGQRAILTLTVTDQGMKSGEVAGVWLSALYESGGKVAEPLESASDNSPANLVDG